RPAQAFQEGGRQPLPATAQAAQIEKHVAFSTWSFGSTWIIRRWLMVEQSAEVHEDAKDLLLLAPYFVALCGAVSIPFREDPATAYGVYIETKHELPDVLQVLATKRPNRDHPAGKRNRLSQDHPVPSHFGI